MQVAGSFIFPLRGNTRSIESSQFTRHDPGIAQNNTIDFPASTTTNVSDLLSLSLFLLLVFASSYASVSCLLWLAVQQNDGFHTRLARSSDGLFSVSEQALAFVLTLVKSRKRACNNRRPHQQHRQPDMGFLLLGDGLSCIP